MQLFEPSMHTKLVNLSILLGLQNSAIDPRLLKKDYPIKTIALRVPLPEMGKDMAVVPDAGFSSQTENSILFLECKSGGIDTVDGSSQVDKFIFIQKKPEVILRTKNEFDVKKENLAVEFAILCSDIEKIKQCHQMKSIPYPVLYFDQQQSIVKIADFNKIGFSRKSLQEAFSEPIKISHLPVLLYPFGPYDAEHNYPYIIKNVFLMIVEANMNLIKFERMPSIDALVIERFPTLKMMDKVEFEELISLIEGVLRKIFPDVDPRSKLNISRYLKYKKGKIIIKRTTVKTFLERLAEALHDIEEQKKQMKISDFSQEGADVDSSILSGINWDNLFPDETRPKEGTDN